MKSIDEYPITLFGGARGGGKSYALRNIFLIKCMQQAGTSAAIFRSSYPELESNHIRPLFQEHPQLRTYWNESKKLITLPNGSTLQFSHCTNEIDVSLYQGRELSLLGIDEAGLWGEGMFRTLLGSNRTSNPNIKARCALTANPGNKGHGWLKRLFIEKRYNSRERAGDYNFIQSLVTDNPALIKNDPDYVHRLNAETNEVLRRAYLYGDWDVSAGRFFSELTREIHLVKPFEIPRHWNRFGSYDFGFNHPAAFGWFANDEDGNTYLYRELIKAGMRVDQFAQELNKYPDTANLYPIVAGHDCWTTKGVLKENTPPTIAEEFQSHGIILRRAVIDRIAGASQLRSYLALRETPNGIKPRFYIFDTCPITFDCLSRMIHDPDRVEDVLKVDATEGDIMTGDDPYDMVRYGLMSRPAITDKPIIKHPHGSEAWAKQEEIDMEESLVERLKEEESATMGQQGWGPSW